MKKFIVEKTLQWTIEADNEKEALAKANIYGDFKLVNSSAVDMDNPDGRSTIYVKDKKGKKR